MAACAGLNSWGISATRLAYIGGERPPRGQGREGGVQILAAAPVTGSVDAPHVGAYHQWVPDGVTVTIYGSYVLRGVIAERRTRMEEDRKQGIARRDGTRARKAEGAARLD